MLVWRQSSALHEYSDYSDYRVTVCMNTFLIRSSEPPDRPDTKSGALTFIIGMPSSPERAHSKWIRQRKKLLKHFWRRFIQKQKRDTLNFAILIML
ncbi:hypothetical protein LSTR_LSTR002552 [Laodelphax striatellus]|uniref:Uncharacterized protein n=1 Tax=Laodelphax striatellus TaxID=195883 RepID=A0A482XMV2_LAOST|nr:hypothetical protein LSTR_LSTR002552 [Laodelphax striatellus]